MANSGDRKTTEEKSFGGARRRRRTADYARVRADIYRVRVDRCVAERAEEFRVIRPVFLRQWFLYGVAVCARQLVRRPLLLSEQAHLPAGGLFTRLPPGN